MPAPYWGYMDPEREELTNALMRAQIKQAERAPELQERQLTLQEALLSEQAAGREAQMTVEQGRQMRAMQTAELEQMKMMLPEVKVVGDMLVEYDKMTGQSRLLAEDPDSFENEYGVMQVMSGGQQRFTPWLNLKEGESYQRNPMTGDMTVYSSTGEVKSIFPFMGFEPSSFAEMQNANTRLQELGVKQRAQYVNEQQLILNAKQVGINEARARSDIDKNTAQVKYWFLGRMLEERRIDLEETFGYLQAENDAVNTEIYRLGTVGGLAAKMETNRLTELRDKNTHQMNVLEHELALIEAQDVSERGWANIDLRGKEGILEEMKHKLNEFVTMTKLPLELQDLASRIGSREFGDRIKGLEIELKIAGQNSLDAFRNAMLANADRDYVQGAYEFDVSLNEKARQFNISQNFLETNTAFLNDLKVRADTRAEKGLALDFTVASWNQFKDQLTLDLAVANFQLNELVSMEELAQGAERNVIAGQRVAIAQQMANYEGLLATTTAMLNEARTERLQLLGPLEAEAMEVGIEYERALTGKVGAATRRIEQLAPLEVLETIARTRKLGIEAESFETLLPHRVEEIRTQIARLGDLTRLKEEELDLGTKNYLLNVKKFADLKLSRAEEQALGWGNLGIRTEKLDLARDRFDWKKGEDILDRAGKVLGDARKDTKHLLEMMRVAVSTHGGLYGVKTEEELIKAAETLAELIQGDSSISPALQAKWLAGTSNLMGVTLTRALAGEDVDADYLRHFENMMRQAQADVAEIGGLPPPVPEYDGISLTDIMARAKHMYNEGTYKGWNENKKLKRIEKYVKRWFKDLDDYESVVQDWKRRSGQ